MGLRVQGLEFMFRVWGGGFRLQVGGLVFKAHRLFGHSTLGARVIKRRKLDLEGHPLVLDEEEKVVVRARQLGRLLHQVRRRPPVPPLPSAYRGQQRHYPFSFQQRNSPFSSAHRDVTPVLQGYLAPRTLQWACA